MRLRVQLGHYDQSLSHFLPSLVVLMYEENKKILDDAIASLRKEADAMSGIFVGAVVAAIVMFLLLAAPDIAAQWRKDLPNRISEAEKKNQELEKRYQDLYAMYASCLTAEERKEETLTEQQQLSKIICSGNAHISSLQSKLEWYTTVSEMRLSNEKGELLVKLIPALILAVFAGSLLNYRHLKTKEVELITKRVDLRNNSVNHGINTETEIKS